MRYSRMFGRTLRDAPAGFDSTSATLLTRAGFIRQHGTGLFSILPLGTRSVRRIKQVIREEMTAIGFEELSMPVVQQADIWKESGRWEKIGDELARLHDRSGRDLLIALSHEDLATDLVRREVHSYRQLPVRFFQIQTKFRDEPRPRSGLLRVREFEMKDGYSFHTDQQDFERTYNNCYRAYLRIFTRCGLPVVVVDSDSGYMGGHSSQEFMVEAEAGEDHILICPAGDFAANRDAVAARVETTSEDMLPLEEVATPDATTIASVARFLGIDADRTLKAVFYDMAGRLVLVVIRGDLEINISRFTALLGVETMIPANNKLIRASGAVPGYASPVGLNSDVLVIADVSAQTPNLVAGGNRAGFHLRNVNLGRDYEADQIAEIALLTGGARCPRCGTALIERRAIEVGHIYALGTAYSRPMKALYSDEVGRDRELVMGSYGIGLGRLLAAVAERHHDDDGLTWPVSVAPFFVHLVMIGSDSDVQRMADKVYRDLNDVMIATLYDDRDESAGVKFADADLIGVPIRVTVSNRSLQAGGAEVKRRDQNRESTRIVPVEELADFVITEVDDMTAALDAAADREGIRAPA